MFPELDPLEEEVMEDVTVDPRCPLVPSERASMLERVSALHASGIPFTLHVIGDGASELITCLERANVPVAAFSRASRVLLYDEDGAHPA